MVQFPRISLRACSPPRSLRSLAFFVPLFRPPTLRSSSRLPPSPVLSLLSWHDHRRPDPGRRISRRKPWPTQGERLRAATAPGSLAVLTNPRSPNTNDRSPTISRLLTYLFSNLWGKARSRFCRDGNMPCAVDRLERREKKNSNLLLVSCFPRRLCISIGLGHSHRVLLPSIFIFSLIFKIQVTYRSDQVCPLSFAICCRASFNINIKLLFFYLWWCRRHF